MINMRGNNRKIGVITAFYKGKPYHMEFSGYERLIDFIKYDNLYFNQEFKKIETDLPSMHY